MTFATERLIADRLTCRRGGRLLFENLSFSIPRGSGLVLTGPNGVGKTSLLRILGGLLRPESGEARLESGDDIPLAERCHFLGVRDGLKASLTPGEHIVFWRSIDPAWSGLPTKSRDGHLRAILSEFVLLDLADTPCGWLSTGQRRRVAMARLICEARPIWLLDEPLNGLDSDGAELVRRHATRYMASGGIIVAASHQPISWPYLTTLPLDVPDAERSAPESLTQ